MKKISSQQVVLALILVLSLLGGGVAVYTTMHGPWGYSDPVEYLSVARSLDRGMGLGYYEGSGRFTPETIHPPFYSLVLSAIGLFGVDPVVAARWLNVLAFAASIFLAGWIFYRYSRFRWLGILASVLMFVFPPMLTMFVSSYSEPLFVLSILAGGLCLLVYLRRQTAGLLILGGLVVGTTPGTRYAGIGMLAAAGLAVLLFSAGRFWRRLGKAALFSLVAGLPILSWLAWVYFSSTHSVGGRNLNLGLKGLALQFQNFRAVFIDTISRWVPYYSHLPALPYRVRLVLLGVGILALVGLSIWADRRLHKSAASRPAGLDMPLFTYFGAAAVLFVAVNLATYLFTLPTIDIDNRTMLPLYVCSVMTICAAVALWSAAWFSQGWRRWFQVAVCLATAACVVWYTHQSLAVVDQYKNGDGLTAYHWGQSTLIQAARDLPADRPVITNDWELTMLWTGRQIYGFWVTFPTDSPLQAAPYGSLASDANQVRFCEKGGALIIYNDFRSQFTSNFPQATDAQREQLFDGLKVYGTYPDGTIYLCH